MEYLVETVDQGTKEKSFTMLRHDTLKRHNPKSSLNRNSRVQYMYPEDPEPGEDQTWFHGIIIFNSSKRIVILYKI